ncbi:MAG: S9 family peptidase [Lacunisphaera sp.]|nr:S9 family peptidase [Lacunisphaera sp.]
MKITLATIVAAGALALTVSAAPAVPPEIPVETLFQNPTISNLEFSPDGKKVLCLVPYERRQNLAVIDLEKGAKNLLSSFKDQQATSPFWASDNRILFGVDDKGKEQFQIYAVNPDGSEAVTLPFDRSVRLKKRLPDDPKNFLVLAGITYRTWWDVALMNLKTGKLSPPIARAPGNVEDYVIDHKNVVRVAMVSDNVTKINKVLYRDANLEEWQELTSYPFDHEGWTPIAFDGDNRTLFVSSDIGRKTRAIYRYDTATKTMGELVFADDTYDIHTDDVNAIIYDESKDKVVGIQYEADRRRFHWLDEEMKAIHGRMEKALPDTVHQPVQFAEDGSKIIFYSYSDRDPGVFYIYDRKRQQVSELAVIKPAIDPAQMAPKKPVVFKARDGLTLHGYLTLPVGRDAKNLPLIIHPHGGPYGPRDMWGYDPEVQFYANRGYAVLQINFRGSGGYGAWFEAAGFKKWGLEMQDDLSDGVKWAVDQGLADPKRVLIAGASYGGYATMAGLVYTPELYCAGINYVGVVDINNLIPKAMPADLMHWRHTRLGNPGDSADRKRVHDTSPVHFAERVRVPLLMAYGKNDPRVTIDQAYDIERALKRSNVPYELIIEKDEGHGFRMEEKRIAFYKRIDAFLKQHVPTAAP